MVKLKYKNQREKVGTKYTELCREDQMIFGAIACIDAENMLKPNIRHKNKFIGGTNMKKTLPIILALVMVLSL